jgi:protein-tyrosine kinase
MDNPISKKYQSCSDDYEELKAKLLNLCTQREVKTIMLTSCHQRDGVSTTARNLASSLATDALAKVLLVELNPNGLGVDAEHQDKPIDSSSSFKNLNELMTQQDNPLQRKLYAHPGNYALISLKPDFVCSSSVVQSEVFKGLLNLFKAHYSYVILDAPPVFPSSGCLALGNLSDGVILVIRSEHTRQSVARHAIMQLEDSGAKLLGTVINMKKHYIPDFIYRRL